MSHHLLFCKLDDSLRGFFRDFNREEMPRIRKYADLTTRYLFRQQIGIRRRDNFIVRTEKDQCRHGNIR